MHALFAEIFGLDAVVVVIVVVVVLFGGSQIPKLARSLGSAQSEFKKGLAEGAKGSAASDTAGATGASDKAAKDADGPSAATG